MASLRQSIIVSTLFTLFGGPGILLVYVPWRVTGFHIPSGDPTVRIVVAVVLMVVGLVPLLESIWRFIVVGRGSLFPAVPTEHLVVSGLYRYVRNPMYLGVLTVITGEALLFWSGGLIVELVTVWIGIQLFVLFYEEPRLTKAFPDEYPRYRRNVRRWLPRLAPGTDTSR
jgi:protein-S-isoprenylcysteine O-methyltransferase Ste14